MCFHKNTKFLSPSDKDKDEAMETSSSEQDKDKEEKAASEEGAEDKRKKLEHDIEEGNIATAAAAALASAATKAKVRLRESADTAKHTLAGLIVLMLT